MTLTDTSSAPAPVTDDKIETPDDACITIPEIGQKILTRDMATVTVTEIHDGGRRLTVTGDTGEPAQIERIRTGYWVLASVLDPANIPPGDTGDWPGEDADPAYLLYSWLREVDYGLRGPIADAPDTMHCYACGGYDGITYKEQAVIEFGGVAEAHRDPTQVYLLECGHMAI